MAVDTSEQDAAGIAFTMEQYDALLERLLETDHSFVGFEPPAPGDILLRHDVAISPQRALAMARREAKLGVTSTYFFLVTAPVYNLLTVENQYALRRIEKLGHDIGLYFDVHHNWERRPEAETLIQRVLAERRILERVTNGPVEAVAFRDAPEWVLDVSFEQFVNVYGPTYFTDIEYVEDTDQRWRRRHPFADGLPETAQILVHPGQWYDRDWPLETIADALAEQSHGAIDEYLSHLGR